MHIKVKVFPDSKKEVVRKEREGTFTVYIREPPLAGQANKRVTQILQELFPNTRIRLVSGHSKQNKVFEIIQ